MIWVRILLGFCVGSIVGAIAGGGVAYGAGWLSMMKYPDDPTAGSVAIIAIATIPGGAALGAYVGIRLALGLGLATHAEDDDEGFSEQ